MLFLKQDKKMMRLMTLLYRHDGEWCKYLDLARHLDVSLKTVKSYLENSESIFSKHALFEYSSAMVRVSFNANFGLLTMQRTFLYHSLIVQILYHTFFKPNMDKLDLSLLLNCSETSIFRNIQQFNEILASVYDLQFSYATLQFVGTEREIQKFYINFFIEIFPDPMQWAFDGYISEEDVQALTRILAKYIRGQHLYPAHFKYIKVALAVAALRLKQGFKVPINSYNPDICNKIAHILQIPAGRLLLDHYFQDWAMTPIHCLYQILAYFLSEEFQFFFKDAPFGYKKDLRFEKQHAFYEKNVTYLLKKYGLVLDDPDAFYDTLFTYFKFKLTNIDTSDFFINHSDYFLNYVKFFNSDFHNDLYAILEDYLNQFHPRIKHRARDLTYTVYTLWPDLLPQLVANMPPYRALVISHYDHYYAKTLMNMVNNINPQLVKAEVYEHCEIDFDEIEKSPYEIIITDFVIDRELEGKLVFSFEQLPLPNKLQRLVLAITYDRISHILAKHPEEYTTYRKNIGLE